MSNASTMMPAPRPDTALVVELRLLGAAELTINRRPVAALPPKDALLLATLALDGAHPREHLATLLWTDTPATGARANLRQRIKKLQDQSGQALLQLRGGTVALAPQVQLDLASLGGSLRANPQAAQGPLLGRVAFDDGDAAAVWLAQARQRTHAMRNAALLQIVHALEDQLQLDAALPYCERLVADNPDDEAAVRRLMQLHFRRADRNAALVAYRSLAQRLREQDQPQPDGQTRDLLHLIQSTPVHTPAHAPPAAAWTALLRPPLLVQREEEWALLQQAWLSGAVVLVTGDAGIGKTRLLEDFANTMSVPLRLRAQFGDGAVPYALLARWVHAQPCATLPDWARAELARLVPALGVAPAGPLSPLHLGQAMQLLAGLQPAVLIDDLHFADAASLALLPSVLGGVQHCLLGCRANEMPAALQHWLDEARHRVVQVQIKPWTEEGVAQLLRNAALALEDAPGWARLLWAHTGGQPLLLLETLRALMMARAAPSGLGLPPQALSVPPHILQLMQRRLAQLPQLARSLLHVAALARDAFAPDLAAAVLRLPLAALSVPWAELTGAALMTDSGRVHDLVLEAVRLSLDPPLAVLLHRSVAHWLVQRGTPPARLALHWAAGGEPALAAACHQAAATAATELSQPIVAAEFHAAAAQAWQQAGNDAQAFQAGTDEAKGWVTAGDIQRALERCDALLARAASLHQQTDARRIKAMGLVYGGRVAEALPIASAAHEAAITLGQDAWRGELAALCALAATVVGQRERAEFFIADESATPRQADEWHNNITRLSTIGAALSYMGRLHEALQRTEASIAIADRPAARAEQATLESNAAHLLMQLGRLREARQRACDALQRQTALGLEKGIAGLTARVHVGLYSAGLGEFDTAVSELNSSLQAFKALNATARVPLVENHLVQVWTHLGQPAKAMQLLQSSDELLSHSNRVRRNTLRAALASLCGISVPQQQLPNSTGVVDPSTAAQHDIVCARGLPAEERRLRSLELEQKFAAEERLACVLSAQLLQLTALHEMRLPEAEPLALRLQADLVDRLPAITYWPQAQWTVYQALLATGQERAAQQALADAWHWIDRAHSQHVAPQLQQAFLTKNLVNAEVRKAWLKKFS